jgi:hypothetical protein
MAKLVSAFLQLFVANAPEDITVPLPFDIIAVAISVVSSDPSAKIWIWSKQNRIHLQILSSITH